MAVKYVKDFAFDSGFGYTGSAGKTPVRGYNRGGKVFDNSTRNPISKFPELAPAMVGKGPGKMGGKTSDVAPMSTAKANPQIAKYAKGGKVKKPPMAKPMKAKMMKKAEGGPVAEITESDGMSPLQAMAQPAPYDYMKDIVVERELPALPEPPPFDPMAGVSLGDRVPVGALTPLPEEPIYGKPEEAPLPNVYDMRQRYRRDFDPMPVNRAEARRSAMQERAGMNRDTAMRPGMRGMAESKARRAMPVAPREPMIQLPRAPQGGIMTYAKGGKVSKGEQKIGKVMGEFKRGELHSGSKKGPVVTNPKQAKAIALSEARAAGAKIPKKAMGGKACG